jgi:hypothetical protein
LEGSRQQQQQITGFAPTVLLSSNFNTARFLSGRIVGYFGVGSGDVLAPSNVIE